MKDVLADARVADLARLDVIDLGASGELLLNTSFVDEVLAAVFRFGWRPRDAVWAVVASRARKAGVRETCDVDALAAVVSRLLPGATVHVP